MVTTNVASLPAAAAAVTQIEVFSFSLQKTLLPKMQLPQLRSQHKYIMS